MSADPFRDLNQLDVQHRMTPVYRAGRDLQAENNRDPVILMNPGDLAGLTRFCGWRIRRRPVVPAGEAWLVVEDVIPWPTRKVALWT